MVVIPAMILTYAKANEHASQLYEDLMYSYNRVVRPVKNASDVLTIKFGASLIRIIDVVSVCSQIICINFKLFEFLFRIQKIKFLPRIYGWKW